MAIAIDALLIGLPLLSFIAGKSLFRPISGSGLIYAANLAVHTTALPPVPPLPIRSRGFRCRTREMQRASRSCREGKTLFRMYPCLIITSSLPCRTANTSSRRGRCHSDRRSDGQASLRSFRCVEAARRASLVRRAMPDRLPGAAVSTSSGRPCPHGDVKTRTSCEAWAWAWAWAWRVASLPDPCSAVNPVAVGGSIALSHCWRHGSEGLTARTSSLPYLCLGRGAGR